MLTVIAAYAAALNFSHVHGDGMVLQRAPLRASVWGWAAPGANVTLTLDDNDAVLATASASAQGKWRASLPPQPASPLGSTGVTLRATSSISGDAEAAISDVVFGDVFVCSKFFLLFPTVACSALCNHPKLTPPQHQCTNTLHANIMYCSQRYCVRWPVEHGLQRERPTQ